MHCFTYRERLFKVWHQKWKSKYETPNSNVNSQFYDNTSGGTRLCQVHFQHPLIWPDPPTLNWGAFCDFWVIKFSQKRIVRAAQTSRTTLWPPPPQGVGLPDQNVSYNLSRGDVVLHAKFEHCRSNGLAAYREQSHLALPANRVLRWTKWCWSNRERFPNRLRWLERRCILKRIGSNPDKFLIGPVIFFPNSV